LGFDSIGNLISRMSYRDGQLDGRAEYYLEANRIRHASYKMGELQGECLDFDAKGSVVQSSTYRDNYLHGVSRRYKPSGELIEELDYVRGLPQKSQAHAGSADSAGGPGGLDSSWLSRLKSFLRGD